MGSPEVDLDSCISARDMLELDIPRDMSFECVRCKKMFTLASGGDEKACTYEKEEKIKVKERYHPGYLVCWFNCHHFAILQLVTLSMNLWFHIAKCISGIFGPVYGWMR